MTGLQTILKPPQTATIDANGLAVLMRSGVPFELVDARSDCESEEGLPGARHLTTKSSRSEIESVLGPKETLVVTYCSSPECPASMRLGEHLRSMGYENVLEFKGGIAEWKQAGFPTDDRCCR